MKKATSIPLPLRVASRRARGRLFPFTWVARRATWILSGRFAKKHNLFVIEDAAHASGTQYRGINIGSAGILPAMPLCFSFYATKNMTTGEGGHG